MYNLTKDRLFHSRILCVKKQTAAIEIASKYKVKNE